MYVVSGNRSFRIYFFALRKIEDAVISVFSNDIYILGTRIMS